MERFKKIQALLFLFSMTFLVSCGEQGGGGGTAQSSGQSGGTTLSIPDAVPLETHTIDVKNAYVDLYQTVLGQDLKNPQGPSPPGEEKRNPWVLNPSDIGLGTSPSMMPYGDTIYCNRMNLVDAAILYYIPEIKEKGLYRIYAWWVSGAFDASNAVRYIIYTASGPVPIRADQSRGGGGWSLLIGKDNQYEFVLGPGAWGSISTYEADTKTLAVANTNVDPGTHEFPSGIGALGISATDAKGTIVCASAMKLELIKPMP